MQSKPKPYGRLPYDMLRLLKEALELNDSEFRPFFIGTEYQAKRSKPAKGVSDGYCPNKNAFEQLLKRFLPKGSW